MSPGLILIAHTRKYQINRKEEIQYSKNSHKKMSNNQLTKTTFPDPHKRTSLSKAATVMADELERAGRDEQRRQEIKDKIRKCMEDIGNNMQEYTFQLFDLREVEGNVGLLKNNHKFANLFNSLKQYNKKLQEGRQNDIINYRLHQFYYSTLRICNTKTSTEVECYLREVESWLSHYNHRRELVIHPNKKIGGRKAEDDIVRQTFKSNLPLEIDQYQRKICLLSAHKGKNKKGDSGDSQKLNNTLGFSRKNCDNSDDQYAQKLMDNQMDDKQNKKQEFGLPNLRAYRMEAMRVRQAIQNRQQAKIFRNLKKNQARIITQSSNNFYKPLRNRKDVFNPPRGVQASPKLLEQADSSNNSKREIVEPEEGAENEQQNHRVIVNSTSMGFYEIKKKNLNKALGFKKTFQSVNFPKFFTHSDGYFNQDYQKATTNWQTTTRQKITPAQIQNISGLSLLKNPFQLVKPKKEKKSGK